MKVSIISQYYWPEDFAAGIYIRELAVELKKRKHDIIVLTSFPNYPHGKIFSGYKGKLFLDEIHEEILVKRSFIIPTSRKLSVFIRVLTHLSFSFSLFFNYLFTRKSDVVYVVFPILPLALVSLFISKIKGTPVVFGVKDLSVQGLVSSGKVTNKYLLKILEKLEIKLYSYANLIQVASTLHVNYLIKKGIKKEKIILISDWANPDEILPKPRLNDFSIKMKLEKKFVVLYSGNIGYSSELIPLIKAAKLLEHYQDIYFLVIGNGPLQPSLLKQKENLKLSNVGFLDFQPRTIFADILATSDLSVISLNKNFTHVATQGKIYNIMSSERPVLAIMDKNAMSADLILNKNFGVILDPEDIEEIADKILFFYRNRDIAILMGKNARRCLIEEYSLKNSVDLFENAFFKIHERDLS